MLRACRVHLPAAGQDSCVDGVEDAAHGLHKSEQGLFFIVDHQGSPGHSVFTVAVLGCDPQGPGGPSRL